MRGDFTIIPAGHASAVSQWASGLMREVVAETKLFKSFRGRVGSPLPIWQRDDLATKKGDTVKFDFRPALKDVPVGGGGWLRGAESQMTLYQDEVIVDMLSFSHATDGKLTDQRTIHRLRQEGRLFLRERLAENIEQVMINYLSGSNFQYYPYSSQGNPGTLANFAGNAGATNTNILLGGVQTAESSLTDADNMTTELIDSAVLGAKTGTLITNNGGAATSVTMLTKLKKVGGLSGRSGWLILVSPNQLNQLRADTDLEAAWQYAHVRGLENPLFQDTDVFWHGAYVMEHELVYNGALGASSFEVARGLLLGAGAGCLAATPYMSIDENYMKIDYNKSGIGIDIMFGFDKAAFNSKDFGIIQISTANDPN